MSIKEMRFQTGLSQSKFAVMFDIPVATLKDWEQGRRTPPCYVINMIRTILQYRGMLVDAYQIRQEKEEDFFAVEALLKRAFWNQYVPGSNEHYIAHEMRRHPDFIKELSLVIEEVGKGILGSVMYTKAWLIDESGNRKEILTFGPIGIAPEYQRKGYGKALLEQSFSIAEELGYDVIVIFGNPGNYVGRGFKSCMKYHVGTEGGSYPTAMLVKELKEGALDGRKWFYKGSAALEVDMEGYEAFDKMHEQMVPGYLPSQEEFYIYSRSALNENAR